LLGEVHRLRLGDAAARRAVTRHAARNVQTHLSCGKWLRVSWGQAIAGRLTC
jgi:hypothetical protein